MAVNPIIILAFFSCFIANLIATDASAGNRAEVAIADKQALSTLHNSVTRPVFNETIEYYDICGNCEGDLYREMKEKGCTWIDGKKYHSLTSWSLKWDYGYKRTGNTCAAESFQPIVTISIRYPRWKKPDRPQAKLEEKWDSFVLNLKMHEEGHRDMVVEAVSDVVFAVMKLPPQTDCDTLDRKIKKICNNRMYQLENESNRYDSRTDHGLKQGAGFP